MRRRKPVLSNSNRQRRSGNPSYGKRILSFVLIFCILGCVWVWKETLHERLSARALELGSEEGALMTTAGYLRNELLVVTEYPTIVKEAGMKIGMTIPQSPPDTIWCDSPPPMLALGSSALYCLQLSGIEP